MDFPRCKTCKFWMDRNTPRDVRHYADLSPTQGVCILIREDLSPLVDISGGPEYFDVIVDENFGCVLHEER